MTDLEQSPETPRLAPDRVSRRAMLRGATVSGVALPLLAACGGGDETDGAGSSGDGTTSGDSSPGSGDGSAGSGDGSAGSGGGATVEAADVPVGGGTILKGDKVVVTQPAKGDFKAFTAVCTHQKCLVTSVEDGEIVCKCHQSHYSIEDGSPLSGPAPSALAAKKVTVSGGQVTVS